MARTKSIAQRAEDLTTIEYDTVALALIRDYATTHHYSYTQIAFMLSADHDIDMSVSTVRNHLLAALDNAMTRLDDMREGVAVTLITDMAAQWNALQGQLMAIEIDKAIEITNGAASLRGEDAPTQAQIRGAQAIIKLYHRTLDSIDKLSAKMNQLAKVSELVADTDESAPIVVTVRGSALLSQSNEDS